MKSKLIDKFFRKECTPAEAKKVALYLKANPAILENYLKEKEWNEAQLHEVFPVEFWDDAWENIRQKNKAHASLVTLKKITAIAASVVLAICVIYYLYPSNKNIVAASATKNIPAPVLPQQKFVSNTTLKTLSIRLEDSSLIKLSPASSVHYTVPFQQNKREIYLEGEAYFKVSKDKSRPFIVYAAGLSTTALGTSFNIKTRKKTNTVYVKLYTGKVVIKEVQDFSEWKKDVYLFPGEQLEFDEDAMQIAVSKISDENDAAKAVAAPQIHQQNPDLSNTALKFNDNKLSDVLNKLSTYYNAKISYDTLLVDTINFTGVIMKSDSLPVILKVITKMNNLEVLKNEDGYIISKHE